MPVADLPQNVDVLAAAFGADVDGENEPLQVPSNGGYVWFDVDAITPSRDRPLDEVKDQVVARWRDDEIDDAAQGQGHEMLDKIKAGTSFADVAAADKLKVEWRPGIKRGAPPAGLPAAAVTEIFKIAAGSVGSVEGASPTERIVFRVTEIKVPPLDPEAGDAKRLDEALKARNTEDLIAQYIARLQSEIGVSINAERAEPGHWRRHAELKPPCRSSHRPTPSPRATTAASRRWCGPRWSPISKRRSRRS